MQAVGLAGALAAKLTHSLARGRAVPDGDRPGSSYMASKKTKMQRQRGAFDKLAIRSNKFVMCRRRPAGADVMQPCGSLQRYFCVRGQHIYGIRSDASKCGAVNSRMTNILITLVYTRPNIA